MMFPHLPVGGRFHRSMGYDNRRQLVLSTIRNSLKFEFTQFPNFTGTKITKAPPNHLKLIYSGVVSLFFF